MKINSLVTQQERTIAGKVNEIEGLVDLMFNGVNLSHEDKAVMIDAVLGNGERHRLFCSQAVSKGLRDKTISKAMVYGFPVTIATRPDGSTFPRVEMPESAVNNWITVSVKDLTAEEFVPSVVAYEDLLV